MNSRDHDTDIKSICADSIALLKRINLARHDGSSAMIKKIILDYEGIQNSSQQEKLSSHISNIRHLMDFELDPGFSSAEKLILSTSLKNIELQKLMLKINNNSNDIFSNNASTLHFEAEFLKNSLKDTSKLVKAFQTVDAILTKEEQSKNEEVHKILGISGAKTYTPPISKAERIAEIKAKVTAGNKALREKIKQKPDEKDKKIDEKNIPLSPRDQLSKQSVFAKRKPLISPRSIDPENQSAGKDIKRKKNS